jgi:hypothetical protein
MGKRVSEKQRSKATPRAQKAGRRPATPAEIATPNVPLADPDQIPDTHSDRITQQGKLVPPSETRVKELFADLPDDPRRRLSAICEIYSAIRHEAAQALTPAIARALQELPPGYDEKAQLADQINRALEAACLALRDPETKFPAKFLPHRPRPSSPVSALLLRDTRVPKGGQRHFIRIDDLDVDKRNFELVDTTEPDPPSTRSR